MRVRTMPPALVTALLPFLLLAGCGHAAALAAPPVTLSFCGNDPEPMPTVVQVVCNTGDITANTDTSGYISAPERPLPPADQTVALTCP